MDELINKYQNFLVGLLITVIVAYGTYNYAYKPKIKEITNLKSSLRFIESEIKTVQGGDLLLKDIKAARASIRNEMNELAKKVPAETQSPYLLNEFIQVVGKGLNIDYNLIQPMAAASEQKYRRLPVRVEFEGNFANLSSYLAQLKQLPVTIRVDNMELHRLKDTKKLGIKIQLSAFVTPGGPDKPASKGKVLYPMGDPFKTAAATKTTSQPVKKLEEAKGLRYTGYWMSKDMNAIINDGTYSAGQSVDGYRITKITKEKVTLKKEGKIYELPLVKSK